MRPDAIGILVDSEDKPLNADGFLEQVEFERTPVPIYFWKYLTGSILDKDGSLASQAAMPRGSQYLLQGKSGAGCAARPEWNAFVCAP